MEVKAYEPRQASNTRFIAHENKVLGNQFHNWAIMHNYWEKRAQEKITDKEVKITSAEVTEAQNKAADFKNVEHITVFLTQFELTDLLGRASCQTRYR